MKDLRKYKDAFIVHVAFLDLSSKISIYPAYKAQIILLMTKKVIIAIKYSDFAYDFLKKSAAKLLEHSHINKHSINLEIYK